LSEPKAAWRYDGGGWDGIVGVVDPGANEARLGLAESEGVGYGADVGRLFIDPKWLPGPVSWLGSVDVRGSRRYLEAYKVLKESLSLADELTHCLSSEGSIAETV
jgi:hypothetical protein